MVDVGGKLLGEGPFGRAQPDRSVGPVVAHDALPDHVEGVSEEGLLGLASEVMEPIRHAGRLAPIPGKAGAHPFDEHLELLGGIAADEPPRLGQVSLTQGHGILDGVGFGSFRRELLGNPTGINRGNGDDLRPR